ncbi:hypothetical protein [Polyangium jinanense]|uniref:Uncharacterized protein n=1 Tax=Polyangium jinanense TaxID=2829994 RepID=A0A9X4AYQ2_9BACT|nr:hypothetical protein [Polyangium jinanense]MDC3960351.1 hypothetical protein [Polyangium jinanense]MDC3987515.1 hypothetical protein [Polyangium jinanense]
MSSTTRPSNPAPEGKAPGRTAPRALVEAPPSPTVGHVFRCPACSRVFLVVAAEGATAAPRCACGVELVAGTLPAGAHEIQMRAHAKRHRASRRARPHGEEIDQGYGSSHGYGPGHGGPTSPGDAPACGAEGTPSCDQTPLDIAGDPEKT